MTQPTSRRPDQPIATERLVHRIKLLIYPPEDRHVLVSDEMVLYKAPKHVMSLAEPIIETLAVLILVTVTLTRPRYDGVDLGVLLIGLSLIVMYRWVRLQDISPGNVAAALVVAYVFASQDLPAILVVPGVGLWFLARLGYRILRWWRYEVRYITNRRIIEVTGFLGFRIASMPVAKVTDVVLERTALGEFLGYATLRVESAGRDQALSKVPYLVEPAAFHRLAMRMASKKIDVNVNHLIDVRTVRQVEKK